MTIRKRTIIIGLLVFVFIIAAISVPAWFYYEKKLSHLDTYRESITQTAAEKFNRGLTYETGKATLTLREGVSIRFTNVVIKEKDGSSDFLKVKHAFFRVNLLPLLFNRLVLGEVVLSEPRMSLKRDGAGVLNIADLLVQKEDSNAPKIRKLVIEKGIIDFLDQAAGDNALVTSLENLDCRIYSPFWTKKSFFHIKSLLIESANKAQLALDGTYRPAPSEKPFYESTVRVFIKLKGADLKHYNAYLRKYTPMEQMAGSLTADIKLSGKFSDFNSKGTIKVKKALLSYPGVFRDSLQPQLIDLDFGLKRDEESLHLDVNRLAVDKFEVRGSFGMEDLDGKDPLLKASAVTEFFPLSNYKSYIPWGIIPAHVGNFIDIHVRDGNFRLIEGRLNGRLSQVSHMNKKESVDVLSISAEVNKGVFDAGGTAPVFHDISGNLVLKKRQFLLKNMKGRFGVSPLTMEGGISDFSQPVVYRAEMKLQPQRNEILWLLGKEKFNALDFKGSSILVLSGNGPSDNYRINAGWELTDAAYVYPDVLEKPSKRRNSFTSEITINRDGIQFSSFNYALPPFSLTGTAMFRFSGGMPVSFNIRSANDFDVREAAGIFPLLQSFNPAGTSSVTLAGQGDLKEPGSIQWKGNVLLNNISLKPSSNIKPIKGLTGNVLFNGRSMDTSLFKAGIGESYIQGKLRVDDFRKPRLTCQFNADALRTRDLGLLNPEGEVNFSHVKGQFAFADKTIHIDNLSFELGKSSFFVSGKVSDLALPKISVAVTSPYLTSDDFNRLLSLKYLKEKEEKASAAEFDATLKVDEGVLDDIDFKKLKGEFRYAQDTLDIEALDVNIFDGKFRAKGKVNIKSDGNHHYDANLSVSRMSLEKLQGYLKIGDRTITGRLSLAGDVSADGRNVEEFQRTATGKFDIRAEKGVLKKFSVLSKIFSLLNVFQLAKLKLPDVTTEGMPYNRITSHVSLKEGVLFSDDFFIDSDSLQISSSGKVDFIRKNLDLIAGIHPLQSIDLLAAKIPVAGWLITDERGKLITVHFKVDGSWDDPNVTPMTARSLGKGTLDIFRRVFQLPEKLITDTGEVILGH